MVFRRRTDGRPSAGLALRLSALEIRRNKGRYTLVSMVVALITLLVLFIAGLAEGLGAGNKEYIEKLNADLVVYQKGLDLSITASRLTEGRLEELRAVDGVRDAGLIGVSSASVPLQPKSLNVALIGVQPGRPGEPAVREGTQLSALDADEVLIDQNVAERAGLGVGDSITIKSIQRAEEQFYTLRIVGVTGGQQIFIQPGVILPAQTWERIRPGDVVGRSPELMMNLIAVQLDDPAAATAMAARLGEAVEGIEAVDRVTAYEATPGYAAQQSTLDTQRYFALLISLLVIGGFFQIQTIQKLGQFGMLKAIGAPSWMVASMTVLQITLVTFAGVLLGGLGVLGLSFALPAGIPLIFTPATAAVAIVSMLLIGPISGLISVRAAVRVDPLTALGLSS